VDPTRWLPLFPLSVVLFPGVMLPLHIFEERYKLMVRRCSESDGLIGISLIRNGEEVGATAEPYEIGTVAKITRIDALSDGKLNLAVVGMLRFRIVELNHDQPYLRGRIEPIDDPDPTLPADIVAEIRRDYVDYIRTLRRLSQRSERTVDVPDGLNELSLAIAARLQVTKQEQQALLEASPDQRLRREREILKRENALHQRLGAVTSRHARSSRDASPN
jgi:Lon protease-like protein